MPEMDRPEDWERVVNSPERQNVWSRQGREKKVLMQK